SYCFKNSTGRSCILKIREDIAKHAGASRANFSVLPDISNVPSSIVCTSCVKAVVNTFLNYLSSNPGDFAILGTTQEEINKKLNILQNVVLHFSSFSLYFFFFLNGKIPNTTFSTSSISDPSSSFNVFDNSIYKGLIIGGIVVLVVSFTTGYYIHKNDYIPTAGTNSETNEASKKFKP
ncbi:477_t:CDS:2, partial [Dentiscutata heterogama]